MAEYCAKNNQGSLERRKAATTPLTQVYVNYQRVCLFWYILYVIRAFIQWMDSDNLDRKSVV